MYYHGYTCAELAAYLEKRNITYMFLQHTDEVFCREYESLFADGLAAAQTGGTRLYVRLPQKDALLFAPCIGELNWEEICHAYAEE